MSLNMEAGTFKTHKLQSQTEIDGYGFNSYDDPILMCYYLLCSFPCYFCILVIVFVPTMHPWVYCMHTNGSPSGLHVHYGGLCIGNGNTLSFIMGMHAFFLFANACAECKLIQTKNYNNTT